MKCSLSTFQSSGLSLFRPGEITSYIMETLLEMLFIQYSHKILNLSHPDILHILNNYYELNIFGE